MVLRSPSTKANCILQAEPEKQTSRQGTHIQMADIETGVHYSDHFNIVLEHQHHLYKPWSPPPPHHLKGSFSPKPCKKNKK